MIKGKQILITGGKGFIGSALAERLAPDNDVVCYDITSGDDILDKKALTHVVADSQIIIHTAARLGVGKVLQNTVATLQINYTGTANVLRTALLDARRLEQVICLSTSEIFGTNADRVSEHGTPTFPDATDQRWCYGIGKLAAEHLALGYHYKYGLPITIVRPFNVFGEGRATDHAVSNFIRSALKEEDLIVYGDGSQIRAWCHIDDFCAAVLAMLGNKDAIGKTFNIGNPANALTVNELARKVVWLCGSPRTKIIHKHSPFTDIDIRIPDITLARNVLCFNPKVELDTGLMQTIRWFSAEGSERV